MYSIRSTFNNIFLSINFRWTNKFQDDIISSIIDVPSWQTHSYKILDNSFSDNFQQTPKSIFSFHSFFLLFLTHLFFISSFKTNRAMIFSNLTFHIYTFTSFDAEIKIDRSSVYNLYAKKCCRMGWSITGYDNRYEISYILDPRPRAHTTRR